MHLPRLILVLLFLVALPTFTEANEGNGSLSMAEVEGDPSGMESVESMNISTGPRRPS